MTDETEWELSAFESSEGEVSVKVYQTGGFLRMNAICQNLGVGYLNGNIYGEQARLEDLKIRDDMDQKVGIFGKILGRPRTKSFRSLGIGSRLLNEFVNICRDRGVRRIGGFVVRGDLERTPRLLDWYEKKGFFRQQVDPDGPKTHPDTLWEVVWTGGDAPR